MNSSEVLCLAQRSLTNHYTGRCENLTCANGQTKIGKKKKKERYTIEKEEQVALEKLKISLQIFKQFVINEEDQLEK